MTQLTDNGVFAVKVPSDLLSPQFSFEISIGCMLDLETTDDELVIRHWERACGSPIGKIVIPVPPSSYEFLFCTESATEEDARKVVAWIEIGRSIGYRDYMNPEPFRNLASYKDSISSLLRSKGLDDKNNYALVLRKAIASSI
jgi:hypothetical protein